MLLLYVLGVGLVVLIALIILVCYWRFRRDANSYELSKALHITRDEAQNARECKANKEFYV